MISFRESLGPISKSSKCRFRWFLQDTAALVDPARSKRGVVAYFARYVDDLDIISYLDMRECGACCFFATAQAAMRFKGPGGLELLNIEQGRPVSPLSADIAPARAFSIHLHTYRAPQA